jgi:hypothetical protein
VGLGETRPVECPDREFTQPAAEAVLTQARRLASCPEREYQEQAAALYRTLTAMGRPACDACKDELANWIRDEVPVCEACLAEDDQTAWTELALELGRALPEGWHRAAFVDLARMLGGFGPDGGPSVDVKTLLANLDASLYERG